MKNHFLKYRFTGFLAGFLILAGSLQAQSKLDALFNKLGENKKMTVVNISKEMMGLLASNVEGAVGYEDGMTRLADQIGSMHVITSKLLPLNEQANYNKMIMEFLNNGYKDLMNISSVVGGMQPIESIKIDTTSIDIENISKVQGGRPTNARMCVKPMAKDPTSKYDKISEFIIYVKEGNELSLIAIEGDIYTFQILTLTKLANLKGILNATMKLQGL